MLVLTGFLEPTAGNALIGGYDIRRSLDKVRESLGLCPQHDVLFDSLTVEEHLEFFGRVSNSVVTSHSCMLYHIGVLMHTLDNVLCVQGLVHMKLTSHTSCCAGY